MILKFKYGALWNKTVGKYIGISPRVSYLVTLMEGITSLSMIFRQDIIFFVVTIASIIFLRNVFASEGAYNALSPLVNCSYLPMDFVSCREPEDLKGNDTKKEELGYGCTKYGGQKYEDVEKTKVLCKVLDGIECAGNKSFMKDGVPCIKYSGHYFVTTLIYSVLLGFIGLDRFCLGHTGTAVGKLLTLGGVGIWWIVDIVLLVSGGLMPEDGSNWQPYA